MRDEEGAATVAACLSTAVIGTVNQAEVQAKLVAAGLSESEAWRHLALVGCPSVPFDEEQARIAGGLANVALPYRLSLGDRACLALGLVRKVTVYTTDREWTRLGLDLKIEVIR